MPFQILVNLLIAFIWTFLHHSWTGVTFFIGYLIGMILLYLFRRLLPTRFYLNTVIAIVKLLFIFLIELILANIAVLKQILSPNLKIQPGIFELTTELKKDWEITALACLITLTPGTLVIDVSNDKKHLYIHAMDMPDVNQAINDIKNSFEKAIMEVSR